MGTLYYGDNLDILRRYLKDETVDLVYLDPPFNSAQNYNAFFHEKDGTEAASQIRAFEDTWSWNQESQKVYEELILQPGKVSEVMQAFHTFLGTNDMMAPRLVELRRVLKATGSLYLHCDPTASHYLKLLCDAVMGPENFRNEIIWKRTTAKSLMTKRLPSNHDVILAYEKSEGAAVWNGDTIFRPYDLDNLEEKTATKYSHKDADGRIYRLDSLINPNPNRPNLTYEFLGVKRVWRWTRERMQAAYERRLVVQTNPGTVPQLKRFLDEQRGKPLDDVWDDIPPLNSQASERLGYPTQKPVALLERFIQMSSPTNGLVLDPFCGCGTTIDAAQKHGRQWIGIDITQLATSLIKNRLRDTYGDKIEINTIGEPTTPNEASVLAEQDKYQFQWWALGLVGARPVEQKKGADHGIDGKILFRDDPRAAKPEQIIIQVKGGKTGVKDVRDLRGVLDREKAAVGVLISLQPPTKDMVAEAVSTGFYEHKTITQKYPRLQLRTVKDLMDGKGIERPSNVAAVDETFKKAPKAKAKSHEQPGLNLE
jgi:site-specific DNA-methyltransferase (adenine-specific)